MTAGVDWRGRVGDVWAAEWRATDRSFAALSRVLDAAIVAVAPAPGAGPFRVLDAGCGAGATSLALAAARADADILGIDLSEPLVAVASERAAGAGVAGRVRFVAGDMAAGAAGEGPFDLIVSRHGVMFADDPVRQFAGLHAATRAGGGLVFSCFAAWDRNAFACEAAAVVGAGPPRAGPGPFALADAGRVADILAAAGWRDARVRDVPFAYRAGEGADAVADGLRFLTRIGPAASALREAPADARAGLLARLEAAVRARWTGDAVDFPAAASIWSATA